MGSNLVDFNTSESENAQAMGQARSLSLPSLLRCSRGFLTNVSASSASLVIVG